jgi:hypothetical protein
MPGTFFKNIRKWLGNTSLILNLKEVKRTRSLPKYISVDVADGEKSHNSIIFLSPAINQATGGVKVIFKQAAILNSLNGNFSASVLHPTKPNFKCTWFKHDAAYKLDLKLNPKSDFVVVPEFWAVPHAKLLHELGVKYGIYVQNGYSIVFNNGKELDSAYNNAALILGISEDTVDCIKMAFPECTDRVYRVHCSVNPEQFIASTQKENIICYMPRKMSNHSRLVTFFLNKKLPSNWKILSIDGLNETEVAAILGKSRIFLSFSELEGLSLPPIEAALSGCHVIGYTGEAAKEYWDKEIFTEIYSGDIKAFVNAVLSKIEDLESNPSICNSKAIKKLADTYSTQVELEDMKLISHKIKNVLNSYTNISNHLK